MADGGPPIWPDWADDIDPGWMVSNNVPMEQVKAGDRVQLDTYDEPVTFEVARGPHMTTGEGTGGLLRHALTILRPQDIENTLTGKTQRYLVPYVRRRKPEPVKIVESETYEWARIAHRHIREEAVGKWDKDKWEKFKQEFDTLVKKHQQGEQQ